MATNTQSLIEWLMDLLRDDNARQDFVKDPNHYLDSHGWGNVSSGDIYDALCLNADGDHYSSYRDRDNDHGKDHGDHHPAPHRHHDGEDAGHYLKNYITNNYTYVDDRDTNIDDSIHQRVDTHGGDFHQTIDNDPVVASGDGAVAAGHDIRDSQVTTGNHNIVGDDNKVAGDHSTTSFGSGDAANADFNGAHFGSGSAVSAAGDANAHAEDNDTTTAVRSHGDAAVNVDGDQTTDQAHTDTHSETRLDDHSHVTTHEDVASHNTDITHI